MNELNQHDFRKDDTPLEFAVTAFTYTWVSSVKAFGAGVLWPVTLADYVERKRHQPASLKQYWTLDSEFDFVKDNTILKEILKKKRSKQWKIVLYYFAEMI